MRLRMGKWCRRLKPLKYYLQKLMSRMERRVSIGLLYCDLEPLQILNWFWIPSPETNCRGLTLNCSRFFSISVGNLVSNSTFGEPSVTICLNMLPGKQLCHCFIYLFKTNRFDWRFVLMHTSPSKGGNTPETPQHILLMLWWKLKELWHQLRQCMSPSKKSNCVQSGPLLHVWPFSQLSLSLLCWCEKLTLLTKKNVLLHFANLQHSFLRQMQCR